ncbi:APC/C activator protein CDC20 [Saitozyma sp. JCM 24511]|nr:APC/C activator protein CDC20 [Saitozyma sp. JCM 24511]
MSIYETEFSRRIRASPAARGTSPSSPRHSGTSSLSRRRDGAGALAGDVFVDITVPVRNGSPGSVSRGMSPIGKGKGVMRDYGDRFIPTRDGTDLHAAYQLLPDNGQDDRADASSKPKNRRKSAYGQGTDVDARREEVNATFTHLLKAELFSPSPSASPSRTASPSHQPRPSPSRHAQLRRPMTFDTSNLPHVPSNAYPISSAGTTPMHHHPPPAVHGANGAGSGDRERDRHERELSPASTLPPLPLHAPSTPTSGHGRAPGAGPSSSHHRAHQSQVALTSTARSGTTPPNSSGAGRKSAFSPPPSTGMGSPSTPKKKRLLNFSSPGTARMAALTGSGSGALDDMNHEQYSLSPVGRESQRVLLSPRKGVRQISRTPFKVLDAPELADDFYLNLVSWSASNVLAVGLNSCVYLWSAQTSKVTKLCDLSTTTLNGEEVSDSITGLDWTNRGSTLAIGTNRGTVEIWDAENCKRVRTMSGHTGRVGCLAWNGPILSSGSRDRTILHRDTRMPEHYMRRLSGHHKQEVCGLKWNQDTDQLASGGNDNKLYVWGGTDSRPTWRFGEHRAAVKAIAWSPHQRGVLASGGGTADKKIRFWNSLTGGLVSECDTGSQVCNLMWSRNSNEIVSTHGYSGGPVSNQIHIWRYPSMTQVATLTGHSFRVLYLAMSPDGQTIVTGAGDETLRFWNAFEKGRVGEGAGVVAGGLGGASRAGLNPFAKLR